MKGKRKSTAGPVGSAKPTKVAKKALRAVKEERRKAKLEHRRREKKTYTAGMWAEPAPTHLVARLEKPKHASKYHSYFEFAENTEKKAKKLEFQVTNDSNPPPGFKFVAIGDPTLTNACKELSRARDAMIFIVSSSKEENSKVSEHIYRTGYHFRESIVDDARDIIGETAVSNSVHNVGRVEPIPESQEDINKQADGAIRDLFPRIPNTDRQMIIDHAFRKGTQFHGEPTVGLQPNIPLSRRVQLAVLAHIRHTHTRYDQLLRETTWMNARKVVEPVCLDVLVKWRGDEETGRDQMEEILREVVIITDSEDSDDSSEEDESSEEEGEITSASSTGVSQPNSRNQQRPNQPQSQALESQGPESSSHTRARAHAQAPTEKKAQRGFKRYQAAWNEARTRQHDNPRVPEAGHDGMHFESAATRRPRSALASPPHDQARHPTQARLIPRSSDALHGDIIRDQARYHADSYNIVRKDPYYLQPRPAPSTTMHRDEVLMRPLSERTTRYQNPPIRRGTPSHAIREQGPPLVVRRSPLSHGLQDMLVPSIETASSDAMIDSFRPNVRREICSGYEYPQESYPRRVVERRMQSPAPRQVIVIDDDSPQIKRRRMVREDDSGHFRPLPSRDPAFYIPASHADSHLPPASSVEPRDFLVRRMRLPAQSTQGLFRDVQPSLTGPPVGDRIPIYDAPPDNSYYSPVPDHMRRMETGFGSTQWEGPQIKRQMDSPKLYQEHTCESSYVCRPVDKDMRVIENDRVSRQAQPDFGSKNSIQGPSSPFFPLSSRVSRSDETGHDHVADQAFVHSFSQSRLEPPLPRVRNDGFNVPSERSHQNSFTQGNTAPRYDDRSAGPSASAHPFGARSPVRYLERPMQYRRDQSLAVFPVNGHRPLDDYHVIDKPPPLVREYTPPPPGGGHGPTYVRTVDPRRPIIISP